MIYDERNEWEMIMIAKGRERVMRPVVPDQMSEQQ